MRSRPGRPRQVRRVRRPGRRSSSARTQREHALRVRTAAAAAERGERAGQPGEPAAGLHARARVGDVERLAPARFVRARGRPRVTTPPRSSMSASSACGERARVDGARALVGERARARVRGPGCRARRRLRAACRRARRSRAPSFIVITGASIARQDACAGGIGTPRARAAAPARRGRAHGRRPKRASRALEPGRDAGHGARGEADRVVHELLAERHLELDESRRRRARRARAPRRSSRGSRAARAPRPSRSRGRRRAGRSSPSRPRTRRGRRRPRRPPPSRPSARISSPASAVAGWPAATAAHGETPAGHPRRPADGLLP